MGLWLNTDPEKVAYDLQRWWSGELNTRGPRFWRSYRDRRLSRRFGRADQEAVDLALAQRNSVVPEQGSHDITIVANTPGRLDLPV